MPVALPPLRAGDTRPLPVQLAESVRAAIARGRLRPGERVPSTRDLAAQLGCSRGTVVTAYDQLIGEGYLSATPGSGTRVSPDLPPASPSAADPETPAAGPYRSGGRAAETALIDLSPGLPDGSQLITPTWRAAWRAAAAEPPTPTPPLGLEALRAEIADHLRYMRGLSVRPDSIAITAGAREGLTLLLRVLGLGAAPGGLRIGVESPGYPALRRTLPYLGHTPVPLSTDAEGVAVPPAPARPDPAPELAGAAAPTPNPQLSALIVTPSHQHPNGGVMSAARRAQLSAWAKDSGVLLIEDDFDSELRYASAPLPALAALAPENAAVLGTFSTLISPAIGCGYLVVPPSLTPAVRRTRQVLGQPVGAITQRALAHFLASGQLRRHTARMRRSYRARRDVVRSELDSTPAATLMPITGGFNAVLLTDAPADEVRSRARAAGVALTTLAQYWDSPDAQEGIVLGFGRLPAAALTGALRTVRGCL